jgi:transcriptional regulator with XRE-family HTH domain
MKIPTMSDETFERLAIAEDSGPISVGGLMASLRTRERIGTTPGIFGTLVSFQRRALGLNVEKLAAMASVGIEELLRIEDDDAHKPDPATVRRLAQILKLPASHLLTLSGNTPSKDEKVYQAALKFAARVREAEKLSSRQTKALHDFVQVLMEAA